MSGTLPIMPQDRPTNGQDMDLRNSDSMIGNKQITITNEPIITKRAGRRKINIEFIEDKSRRHITFSKRKAGIMKKAYELSTLTGTQVLLLVASETGHVYTFATPKLQPLITKPEGKNLIQACLNAPDTSQTPPATQPPSRMQSYQPPNPTPPSEPAQQIMYHSQEQNPSQPISMQPHLYDEKPKIFNNRGSIGDNKYVQDPNLASMDVNYPSSANFNAPNSMMNMRGVPPYHSGPMNNRSSYQSMGSPNSNPPQQNYPPQYATQPGQGYSMAPSMPYPQNYHPNSAGSSSHLYSANQKPGNMPLPINSSAPQHQMTGDYKYIPSNNSMEGYPYSHR